MRRRVRNAWNQPAVAKCGLKAAQLDASWVCSSAGLFTMCDKICCQSLEDRDELAAWMIQSDDATVPPSLCQRCLCQCGPAARLPSGIEKIPEISSLAGATLQDGTHSTAGSVQTLKWAEFDAHKHTARMQVFGGAFTGRGATGVWTEPNKCTWNCLINLARCFNYTYFFEFSPDWRKADIKIQSNCPFGCCCLWCVPAYCTLPSCCVAFNMVQTDDSKDGSRWARNSSSCACCGDPNAKMKYTYDLVEVLKPDGTPGRYHEKIATVAPKQMLISR